MEYKCELSSKGKVLNLFFTLQALSNERVGLSHMALRKVELQYSAKKLVILNDALPTF